MLSFFPRDVLDGVLDLIESVSEGFSTTLTRGLQLVCGRYTLALSSALVPQTLSCSFCIEVF